MFGDLQQKVNSGELHKLSSGNYQKVTPDSLGLEGRHHIAMLQTDLFEYRADAADEIGQLGVIVTPLAEDQNFLVRQHGGRDGKETYRVHGLKLQFQIHFPPPVLGGGKEMPFSYA